MENNEGIIEEKKYTAGGYISEIKFNNGTKVPLNKNDIVVLVGANNVGKSQSLKDIYTLCYKKLDTRIIKNIKTIKDGENIKEYMQRICKVTYNGYSNDYKTFGFQNNDSLKRFERFNIENEFGDFRNIFVANLDTQNRLTIVQPPQIISSNGVYEHPIHFCAYDTKKSDWLSNNFKKAFGKDLIADRYNGLQLPLCIGNQILPEDLECKDSVNDMFVEYSKILNGYDKVHEQGDGIKSFTGILLYLMIERFSIYLIDEPEAFLHPPQAKMLGKIIIEALNDSQQMFISTHSEEFLKGLLETNSDRVKIIRIERDGNSNSIYVLDNKKIKEVWDDPILKYSNVMSGLFHNEVVICESDSDCKMYSIINNYLKEQENKYSETLFIHASGKNRIFKIANALKSLNVKVKTIVDIDILNDTNTLNNLINAFNIDWNTIESDYKIIENSLYRKKEEIKVCDFKVLCDSILNSGNENLSDSDIKLVLEKIKKKSKWEDLKKYGESYLKGDAKVSFNNINEIFEKNGIFMVKVGEIENFITEIGDHGPEWVDKVLERYPNFNDNIYIGMRQFIEKMNL